MIIGIDPDLKKSGVCLLDDTGIVSLKSMSITELIELIKSWPSATYAIENVLKNKATYSRGRQNDRVNQNIAQKVGMVKGAASLIIEIITDMTGKAPILVPPGVGKQVKNNAALFKSITGYQGTTNEDKRDAWAIAEWAKLQSVK